MVKMLILFASRRKICIFKNPDSLYDCKRKHSNSVQYSVGKNILSFVRERKKKEGKNNVYFANHLLIHAVLKNVFLACILTIHLIITKSLIPS